MRISHIFSFHFPLPALAVPLYSTMSTMGLLLLYSELSTYDPHLRHRVRDEPRDRLFSVKKVTKHLEETWLPLRRLVVLGDKAQLFLHRSGLCTVYY